MINNLNNALLNKNKDDEYELLRKKSMGLDELEKSNANHYHVFAVCDDISNTFKKIKKNIKTDKEKELYDILYKDYSNLIKEYESIRGGEL